MRKWMVVLILIGLCSPANAYPRVPRSRTVKVFCEQAAPMIAAWAYPTAKYLGNEVQATSTKAIMVIRYLSKWTDKIFYLKLVLYLDADGNIDDLHVINFTAYWPPFVTMTFVKEVISDLLSEDSKNDEANAIARRIRTNWQAMTSKDLCVVILQYCWIRQGYKECYYVGRR